MSEKTESNFQPSAYDLKQDGDLITLSGDDERLAQIGLAACESLNRGLGGMGQNLKEALLSGETLRPGGAYSVYILRGKLYVSTHNARGDAVARQEIKNAIESALSK
ncbi:MAG: hypothetical protein HY545_00970 [Candidatus Doudnabacteria bacterium]|nr:hypothetical protein [Candidatus Doudnabacteria bacterium]